MNTTLMNQTIQCGQPRRGKEITLVLEEMNEEEQRCAATLLHCKHPKQEVVDRFDKNAVITAPTMNILKNQIFQMLEIPDSLFRTTFWKKLMRINGKTIYNFCEEGPAPVQVPVPAPMPMPMPMPAPIAKPKPMGVVYLIKGPDFGYIGQTSRGFEKRMKEHARACLDNRNRNFKTPNSMQQIYTAITNNGGWANVKTSIIEQFEFKSKKEILKKEKNWIRRYKDEIPIYLINSLNTRPDKK